MTYEEAAQYFIETGLALTKIAKANQLNSETLGKYIKRNYNITDIKKYRRKKIDEKYERLYKLFTQNDIGIKKFCLQNHISRHNFTEYIGKRSLLIEPQVTKKDKYQVDENIFGCIDTEEKAYWLGFMYADGYNSGKYIQISISYHDFNHQLIQFVLKNKTIPLQFQLHQKKYVTI